MLSEEILYTIVSYFQGHEHAATLTTIKMNTHEFNNFITRCRYEMNEIKTDIKSIISLAEVNRYMYNVIMKSEYFRKLWVVYYRSLYPSSNEETLVHIGDQTNEQCDIQFDRCMNPYHYIEKTCKYKDIFKKIAKRLFVIQKSNGVYFNEYNKKTLEHLLDKREILNNEIEKLEKRKKIAELDLGIIYDCHISQKQRVSYYRQKNQNQLLNEEANFNDSKSYD